MFLKCIICVRFVVVPSVETVDLRLIWVKALRVRELLFDFSLPLIPPWFYKECLGPHSCLNFWFLTCASIRILGGDIAASLYNAGRGLIAVFQ